MMAGTLNPWLKAQSDDLPGQLGHDFAKGGSPVRHLTRIAEVCKSVGSRLMVAYVPFCGVVSRRYVPSLVELGMDRTTAEALAVDPIYRRQNRVTTGVCTSLELPLADATADLVQAEAAGVPQYWTYRYSSAPCRLRHHRSSNSPCLAWRGSMRTQEPPPVAPVKATSTPAKYQAAQTSR